MKRDLILILNFGTPNSQAIARKVRELAVYCEILPYDVSAEDIKEKNPNGIIFVGAKHAAPEDVESVRKEIAALGLPLLEKPCKKEEDIIRSFLYRDCGCEGDWRMEDFAKNMIAELKEKIGDKKVLCALSGGVDSSVAAVMVHQAIGKNLTCIFVDHGLMRLDEGDQVCDIFNKQYDMNLIRVNAEDRFLSKLKGVTEPERKRKIIGEEFIRVFEEESKKIGAVDYLVQGTIYPDIVESGTKNNPVVKSHHNVGGLPDVVDFKEIIEPLRDLFKDEVREVGRSLDIPEAMVSRQPFPGPGLGIRVIGELTKERLDTLRQADFILRDEIAKAGLDKKIWQYFAVLTNLKSVGVTDDARTYSSVVALRTATSVDAMTADWARIPYEVIGKISERIVREVQGVNRVVYDVTAKPPATIEWE